MIAILDYDMGNVGSVSNMIRKIGYQDVRVTRNRDEIFNSDCIVLPGVGSYDKGMDNLRRYDLVTVIKSHASKGKAIIGICLGMQLLGNSSEEGHEAGLWLIDFDCIRFAFESNERKVPHMGWDYTRIVRTEDTVFRGLDSIQRYYYIHSYYAVCRNEKDILMTCDYGIEFVAAVNNGNIYGFQFHPEKSHKYGMELLSAFLREKVNYA